MSAKMTTGIPKIADPLDRAPLDWTFKGLPSRTEGLTSDRLKNLHLHLFEDDFLFPIAVLQEDVVKANSRWMMRFLGQYGVDFAPHGKTTMSPQLMDLQLQDGAWGLTAATVHHVRAYRSWGARRILMANQLVGKGEIEWIAGEMMRDPEFDFYCLVDSVEGANHLAEQFAAHAVGRPIKVLVEVGIKGGRAGVRSLECGVSVVEAVNKLPALALCGIETFEGLFQTEADGRHRGQHMLEDVVALAAHCDRGGLFESETIILTGGGSGLFDLAASILSGNMFSKPVKVVIRSGCYLVHDDGMYRRLFEQLQQRTGPQPDLGSGLRSALRVWARVLSKPEPGRMICGLGKRDIGNDCDSPVLIDWVRNGTRGPLPAPEGCVVRALNDQHAYVDGPCEPFAVGDLVGFGVSHPCTTFDKWRALVTVSSSYHVTGMVRTYF